MSIITEYDHMTILETYTQREMIGRQTVKENIEHQIIKWFGHLTRMKYQTYL
jgi:hypothetical protein